MGLIEIYMLLFSCSVASESLEPHGLQHARLPCPSPPPGACSNSCPSSQWCHPAISSSVVPFSCLQSLPASGSFPMSQLFASGGQSIGASASVLPMNIQSWFPLGWTGLISLQSRDSQESSPAPQFKSINSSVLSLLYSPNIISTHDYWRNHSLNYMDLIGKVMSLLFNALSRFVIAFLPRSKHLLISWVQSLSQWLWFPLFPHLFTMKWWDQIPWYSFFECWVLSQLFHSPLSPHQEPLLIPLLFMP